MVLPTNLKPRFFKSFDNLSEISVVTGTCFNVFHLFLIGLLFTKSHKYFEKLPNSCWILINAMALVIADCIFKRFLMMLSFVISFSILVSVKRATLLTSKFAKALR